MLGNEVNTLLNDYISAGNHKVNFNAKGLSNGTYYYQLMVGNYKETKKYRINMFCKLLVHNVLKEKYCIIWLYTTKTVCYLHKKYFQLNVESDNGNQY